MDSTEVKLQYKIREKSKRAVPAIIVAAGSSTRMRGINKQFMPILGVPVIVRTLMAFETCSDVSKIIVVTSCNTLQDVQTLCDKYAISKVVAIVEGGANRHESVVSGMSQLDERDEKVLIHDGARPFIKGGTISEVVSALNVFDAAICVNKINDTVKQISEDGIVLSTVDRSKLYAVQTPQGIDVKKYKSACEFVSDIESFTDDASIMEAAGYIVKAVVSSGKNIKITTPDDIAIAEALVKGEDEA